MLVLRQAGIVLAGALLATAMVVLGIWQLQVYQAQGSEAAERRAAEPPVSLMAVAPAGAIVVDGFGRSVAFEGSYDPALQTPGAGAGNRHLSGAHGASAVRRQRGSGGSRPGEPVVGSPAAIAAGTAGRGAAAVGGKHR